MNIMNNKERKAHSIYEVGIVEEVEHKSIAEQGLAHEGPSHEGPYHVEESQFVNGNRSYHFKPNNNLPTH